MLRKGKDLEYNLKKALYLLTGTFGMITLFNTSNEFGKFISCFFIITGYISAGGYDEKILVLNNGGK